MNNIIDTIKVRYDFVEPQQRDELIDWLLKNNESCRKILKINRMPNYQCDIKNLRAFIDHQSIYISGSIHKFYLGNNIDKMEVKDVSLVFNMLNGYLGNLVDTKTAFVRRLDFGVNLLMNYNPSTYISKLYSLSEKKTARYNSQTLTTGNKSKGITIYNKTDESNSKKRFNYINTTIPENLLRIEFYITGRKVFEKIFGQQLPTVDNIIRQSDKLPKILYESYNNLDKSYDSNVNVIKNKNELLWYTITLVGIEKCQHLINYSYDMKSINGQSKYRLNKTVKNAFKYFTPKDDDAIMELNRKMNKWYTECKKEL